jgi:hypothetical protein
MRSPRRAGRWVTILAVTAVVAAGCGETTPTEAAPELARQLARVDRAVTTGDEARIRDRVESLVSATEAARDAGRLDDEQADRILAAADALLARVPAPEPAPQPSASPTPSPTLSPSPEDEDEDEDEEGDNSGPGGGDSKEKPGKDNPDKDKPDKGKGHGKG